jgi:hypothetical protein
MTFYTANKGHSFLILVFSTTFIPSHPSVAIRRGLHSFYHILPTPFAEVPLHLLIGST